jgi:hypothetical protein
MKFFFATIAVASAVIGSIAAPTRHQDTVSKIEQVGNEKAIFLSRARGLTARQEEVDSFSITPAVEDDDSETLLDPTTKRSLPIGQNNIQDAKIKIPARPTLAVREEDEGLEDEGDDHERQEENA